MRAFNAWLVKNSEHPITLGSTLIFLPRISSALHSSHLDGSLPNLCSWPLSSNSAGLTNTSEQCEEAEAVAGVGVHLEGGVGGTAAGAGAGVDGQAEVGGGGEGGVEDEGGDRAGDRARH